MTKKLTDKPDPLLPRTPVTIDGKRYDLCFTFNALAQAKIGLRARGIHFNLLRSLDLAEIDVDAIQPLFYAALLPFRPEMTVEEAFALVTLQTCDVILMGIVEAYGAAFGAQREEGGPPPAGPES